MKKNLIVTIYIVLLFLLPVSKLYAQESIMNDVSYPYLDKLIATAKLNYPLVKIKQQQVLIAQNSFKQSRASWFDMVSFSYIYSPENTINLAATSVVAALFSGYQFAITVNVGQLIERPYTIRNAKANYDIAQLEQQQYDLNLELEVKTRYFNYLREMGALRLRTRTSQDAETVLSQTKHQFELGSETVENYTRATVSYAENNQAKLDAEAAALIAKASLEEIIGRKLE
jgi:outer membrane protein TolC